MQSFHYREFADVGEMISRKQGRRISLVIPTWNEESTIGEVVEVLRKALIEEAQFLDELVVVDSGSKDRTREVASAAGARVVLADEILPEVEAVRGKGENIWKGAACTFGDIVCFVDGDVTNMHPRFVLGTAGPLLSDDSLVYVKAHYERPHGVGEIGERPAGGGRVTEALVRPLFNLFYPELAELAQPLSGEFAVRRPVLETIPMPTGYGVEVAHLIEVLRRWGAQAIAQTDLEERHHRHQSTGSLGRMAFAILHALLPRAAQDRRLRIAGGLPKAYRYFVREEGVLRMTEWNMPDMERPPLLEIPGYRAGQAREGAREASGR